MNFLKLNFQKISEAFFSIPYGVRRFLKIFTVSLSLLILTLAAFWLSFPWQAATELVLAKMAEGGAEDGIVFSANGVDATGAFNPVITVNRMTVDNSFLDIKFLNLTLKLNPLTLLSRGAITGELSLGEGSLTLPDKQQVTWKSAAALLVVSPGVIKIEELNMEGDVTARGFLNISLPRGGIVSSDLSLKVPEPLDKTLTLMEYSIPLVRTGEGEWGLK